MGPWAENCSGAFTLLDITNSKSDNYTNISNGPADRHVKLASSLDININLINCEAKSYIQRLQLLLRFYTGTLYNKGEKEVVLDED
jgi:hypothetical protein